MRPSVLDDALDVLRVRQYFNAITMIREVASGVRRDASFLSAAREAILPLPFDRRGPVDPHPFPPLRDAPLEHFSGRRLALLATGGSGALASVVGAARAFEEAGIRPAVMSLCSGSALFGFPIAAGVSAADTAEKLLALTSHELIDVDWKALAMLVPRLARGFTGFLRGERIEAWYRDWLGAVRLGDLSVPAYAPVWNIEHNRVEYLGPRTHPNMTLARAVRMAVALPLFIEAVEYRGSHYCDGGTADILPVHPLLDIEPVPDAVLAINGFYPHEFLGEDISGWVDQAGSIFYAAAQVRMIQHIELGRESLARLRREVGEVMLIDPVPYSEIRGAGLYRQFMDNRMWPEFMRAGLHATRRALRHASASSPVDRPRPRRQTGARARKSRAT